MTMYEKRYVYSLIWASISDTVKNTGGGKHPPPLVPPVWHVGSMEGPKRAARNHRPVCQGGGDE